MASFPTIILNGSVILVIKRKKELQKTANIMLSSLAVTDLLVGVTVMPTSATIDFFTFRQVSFQSTCALYAVNLFFFPLLYGATIHHLTVIAWERYVAVQKWMDYYQIITNRRLEKIAIGTWLSAIFPTIAYYATTVIVVDRRISNPIVTGWIAVEIVCIFLVAHFYRKVYLGIRNRNLNEIAQIDVLIKGKLDSKVAKTTGLLTAAFISSFTPIFIFVIIGNAVPNIRTNAAFQFAQKFAQMNSLFNPLLYCYRDQRFRNAIRELLGLKKPQAIQSAVGATHVVGRKDPIIRYLEFPKLENRTERLKRSVSCNLAGALYPIHGTPTMVVLKKSLSAPALVQEVAP